MARLRICGNIITVARFCIRDQKARDTIEASALEQTLITNNMFECILIFFQFWA